MKIFELIKYIYYNNNRVIGYRAMRAFLKRYGYEISNTTMHKYVNKELNYKVSSTFVQFILFKNVQFHFLTHSISL